mgnify:FL=1
MKKFVSNNFKYFKNSKANSAFGHIHRLFEENKNAFPEYTKNNFGTGDLLNKYKDIYERVNERKKELKTKRLNEKSNTFIDGAFVFSVEKWEELEKEFSQKELQKMITERMNKYMVGFKNKFGFEPIGFEMHLDEGHEKQIEAKKNNADITLTRNIHAHVSFFNYDFKNDAAPLRNMKKKDWSRCQDLAYECFKDLGFERGISKEITNNQHLEKDAFIEEKQKKLIEELKQKNEIIKQKNEQIKSLNKTGKSKIISINELIDKKSNISALGKERQEISKKLKNQNQNLKNQNQKLQENINLLEKRQNTIFEKMDVIVDFLGKLSSKFLTLIDFKAKRNLEGYFEEIEKINYDFQEVNKTHFLKNDDFSNIVFNSIQKLPDHPEIKKDLKTKLKI